MLTRPDDDESRSQRGGQPATGAVDVADRAEISGRCDSGAGVSDVLRPGSLQTFLAIIAAMSPVIALAGVWLGSRLGSRQETRRWLRDQRQQTYLEYLDLMVALNRLFGVGPRVSKFGSQSAVDAGHDFDGVENAFHDLLEQLEHLEQRLELLVGDDTRALVEELSLVPGTIMELSGDEDTTEEEWDLGRVS